MIRKFQHRGLRRLHERGERGRVGADMLDKIENILALLDIAEGPEDMDLPELRPHPLKGDLAGVWAVTVQGNWRVTWRFEGKDVLDVNLTDYH